MDILGQQQDPQLTHGLSPDCLDFAAERARNGTSFGIKFRFPASWQSGVSSYLYWPFVSLHSELLSVHTFYY